MTRPPGTLVRNATAARVNHWITAGCFVLLLLSGLSMFHPMLFFLSQLFGSGQWTRAVHPWFGTVRGRAIFPNASNTLFPNQFVNTRLLVKTLADATLLPQAAIQRNNDQAFVYVVQPDSTVKSTDIKIVATEGETSAVTGVSPGTQLVTDGFDKLQNGSKVAQRKPEPAESAGSGSAKAKGSAKAAGAAGAAPCDRSKILSRISGISNTARLSRAPALAR